MCDITDIFNLTASGISEGFDVKVCDIIKSFDLTVLYLPESLHSVTTI